MQLRTAALAFFVALTSGCVRSPLQRAQGWWTAETPHVRLETDGGEDTARAAARRLETLDRALATAFYHCQGDSAEDDVLDVTLLTHDDEYDELRPQSAGVAFQGVEGLVVLAPRIVLRGAATSDVGGDQVFAHELTHDYVRACFPAAPPWLHEGLAAVFETVTIDGSRVIAGQPAYVISDMAFADVDYDGAREIPVVPRVRVPRPSVLVRLSSALFWDPGDTGLRTSRQARTGNYAGAWALVHMLGLGPNAALRQRFLGYLDSLRRAQAPAALAFDAAFAGVDLDRAFDAYLARDRFVPFTRPWHDEIPEPRVARLSESRAHLAWAALHLRAHHADAAALAMPHLEAAELDADTRALALLLHARLEPEREAELVTEAVAADPESPDVLHASIYVAHRSGDPSALARAEALASRAELRAADLAIIAAVEDEAGHSEEAYAHARAALNREPRAALAWQALGHAAYHLGAYDEAREAMLRVLSGGAHSSPALVRDAIEWLRRINVASSQTPTVDPIVQRTADSALE